MSTLTFSIIQTNLVWESPEENRSVLESKIESIPSGTEIIILPEMFTTAFSMNPTLHAETMEGETLQWMSRISQQKKSIIVGSLKKSLK
jgi:predicted amidohydrolase